MKGIRHLLLVGLVMGFGVTTVSAQSLADVAKKEKQRRQTNSETATKTITDRELTQGYRSGLPATRAANGGAAEDATGATDAAATSEGEGEAEEPEDETKTPEYWQNRVAGSKAKIASLEEQLQKDDWGEGLRQGVDPRGANNLSRRQEAEQQLSAAKAELAAIQTEARRAGVPAGWVR